MRELMTSASTHMYNSNTHMRRQVRAHTSVRQKFTYDLFTHHSMYIYTNMLWCVNNYIVRDWSSKSILMVQYARRFNGVKPGYQQGQEVGSAWDGRNKWYCVCALSGVQASTAATICTMYVCLPSSLKVGCHSLCMRISTYDHVCFS